jgi:nucleoside-diphosphate-sugar epimerase
MGVYGESANPGDDGRAVRVDEDLPLRPADIYGFSKVVGEEMCRWMGRERGIPSIALRYGMFVPEPFFRYGIRLLYGGVDTDDVVAAVMAALSAMSDGKLGWDSFNVQSPLPFGEDDGLELRRDPLTVLDRYYPGARSLLTQRGVDRLGPIDRYFPVDRLVTRLGLRPSHSFGAWLDELRRRPNERATANPPWP